MSETQVTQTARAGRVLGGRYTLISPIARGGMGEVWRVRDQRTGALLAAKVLRSELRGEEISLSRLRLEAKNTLASRHPNVASVLDSGEDEGQGWIVMELVDGRPLTDYVGSGARLTPDRLVPILTQTAYALDSLSQAGVVHRDIKPANILIRKDGMVKLTDFGISFARGQANLTAAGMVMGTAQYLAPEQAMGEEATLAGDLYSLGVIAYEALAGQRPFTGASQLDIAMAHVKQEIPPLPEDVPEPMAQIVYWLMAKEPTERPASGAALVRALSRIASEVGADTGPVPLTAAGDDEAQAPEPPAPVKPASAQAPEPPAPVKPASAQAPEPPAPAGPASAQAATTATAPSLQRRSSAARPASGDHVERQAEQPGATPRVAPVPGAAARKMSWRPVDADSVVPGARVGPVVSKKPKHPESAQTRTPRSGVASATPHGASARDSRVGAWVVGLLVALTLVLIVIAMVRSHGDSQAIASEALARCSQTEVTAWWNSAIAC